MGSEHGIDAPARPAEKTGMNDLETKNKSNYHLYAHRDTPTDTLISHSVLPVGRELSDWIHRWSASSPQAVGEDFIFISHQNPDYIGWSQYLHSLVRDDLNELNKTQQTCYSLHICRMDTRIKQKMNFSFQWLYLTMEGNSRIIKTSSEIQSQLLF